MEEFFGPIEALELLKKGKKVSTRDWSEDSYIHMVNGRIVDNDGADSGMWIGTEDLSTKKWKIFRGDDVKFAYGVIDLMESLEKGIWKYATVVGNDVWGLDDRIVLKGGDTLEWEGGEGIPMYKTFLEAKFQLHK